MGFVIRVVVNAAAILLAANLIPGIYVHSLWSAAIAGLVLGVVNAIVRPILVVLTLPITVVTLGLFLFVLNAICLWLTAVLVEGFGVDGILPAFLGALVVSVVSWLLTRLVSDRGRMGDDGRAR